MNTVQFGCGLKDCNNELRRLHTAAHLLYAALRQILGNEVTRKNINITPERILLKFTFSRPITETELDAVERLVNKVIQAKVDVTHNDIEYMIGNFSKEICGGTHASNTGELGHFIIVNEKPVAQGVRQIKAILI